MNNDRKNNWIVGIVVFILAFLLFKSCGGCLGCTGCAAAGCASSCYQAGQSINNGCSESSGNNNGGSNNGADYGINLSAKDELYINDYTASLTEADKSAIVRVGEQLEQSCGVQFVEVVIDDKSLLGNDELSDYAYRLFNYWGVGDSSTNKGVLLLINIAEDSYIGNAYCIEGTGLENLLPASELGDIINEHVLPNLDQRSFAAAATEGYQALAARLAEISGGTNAAD